MSVVEQVGTDLLKAMKAQEALKTGVLRMAKAALKNREIDKGEGLDDAEALKVLQSLVKQRQESAEQFRKGGREELAAKEEEEIGILRPYLPAEASDAEIQAAVARAVESTGASTSKDMGRVMKAALADLKSTGCLVDGKRVNEVVRAKLAG
jgi:uncharacterized protein YqeY